MSDDATATGLHAHADLAPGTVLAGRFRIERLLGVGGMGVVYRATDQALDVPVALKLLRPELAAKPQAFERFRQELLLARQVSNPHVVRIHDIGQHEGRWLISMDYVDGESLDKRLDRDGRLPVDEALRIARQIAEGLGAAHARDVVHRDLKPANVLLDRDGNAYVNDFGIARSLVSSGYTQSGAVVGTPDYLSPEQARGEGVDPRSDLYALGLILYEMLAGELPFAGGTVAEVLGQRMVRTPPPVTKLRPELPTWIARLVDKLLRTQPAHRFQSAKEVIAAIDRREVPREFRPSRRAWLTAAAVLVLGVGIGGAWWAMQRGSDGAIAELPPLQRLLVLPVAHEGDDAALIARALAFGDILRESLAGAGIAVVDSERTWQAQRQLDPTGDARLEPEASRAIVAADRTLSPRLLHTGAAWRVSAQLRSSEGEMRTIEGADAADAVAAWQAWLPRLAAALGVDAASLAALPPTPALDAYGAGLRARQDNRYADALQHFRAAAAAAPRFAQAWLAQADAALAIGEEDVAYAALEQGQRNAAVAPERLRRRIAAARALLDGDAALAQQSWQLQVRAQPDDTYAALQLARAQGAGGGFDAAVAALKALAAKDDNDPRVWFELGKFSILQGDARHAVDEYLLRAMLLYRRSRDQYGLAETVNALGVGYGRLGQTRDAEEQYRKAVELRGALGNRRGVATSLGNLAAVLSLRGEFDAAAQALQQARTLHTALGNREGLATTENELGLLAEERGDHRGALDAFRRALQAWQQAGDAHGAAETLNNIGFAHYQLGAYDSAQAFWQQAADAYAKLGDQTGDVRTTQNLGLLDVARGRWSEARERLQRSLATAEQQQMVEEAAVSRRNLAELALWQGRIDDSLDQAGKAQAAFRQREDLRGALDAGLLRVQALLVAHSDALARRELEALAQELQQASLEHRAIAASLRGALHARAGDARAAAKAWDEAAQLAQRAGIRQLQLQVALQRAPDDPRLDADTAALGHAGLRLLWLEHGVAGALARRDADAAIAAYREAQGLLRGKTYGGAFRLHALGARAFAEGGDAGASAIATSASASALQDLRAHVPAALRDAFDAAPDNARVDATQLAAEPAR